jgi:hypothetical protein
MTGSIGFDFGKCKVPAKGFKKVTKISAKLRKYGTTTLGST